MEELEKREVEGGNLNGLAKYEGVNSEDSDTAAVLTVTKKKSPFKSQDYLRSVGGNRITLGKNDSITNNMENRSASFCSSPEGSLHQIALDMINFSSPKGSMSYKKLQHVLRLHASFYIDLKPSILFASNQGALAKMLQGYGLQRLETAPQRNRTNVILVETPIYWSNASSCPLTEVECQNHTRIIVQTEQYFKPFLGNCHKSTNCIVLEFSDHNYWEAQKRGWGDSFVLLPVMTQTPSRFETLETKEVKHLRNRMYDIVFFATVTARRQVLGELSEKYLKSHPNQTNMVTRTSVTNTNGIANAYKEAKVCLVMHAHSDKSGLEYHRLSEFAPFGCVPVMEETHDQIGMKQFRECGSVIFANATNLFKAAANVTTAIDQGWNLDKEHIDWWRAGIQWETILPSVFF